MRPTTLTVEGLTAFRQVQTIDLSKLGLFVITGPTGAGKTSILDAITFALYGNVVRVKSGELRDLITHNAALARVELEFEVKGQTYRIIRRMRRKGQQEAMLERKEGDEFIALAEASGVKAVDRQVADLLGLDFNAFTKAVLLPQGRFHEFLSGDADGRRSILSRLLELEKYEKMGASARSQARQLTATLDERQRRIDEDYSDATPAVLQDVEARMTAARQRLDATAAAKKEAGEIAAATQSEVEVVNALERGLEALGGIQS